MAPHPPHIALAFPLRQYSYHLVRSAPDPLNRHRQALDELVDMAMDLARAVHRTATADAGTPPGEAAVASFDRLARAVRRTVLLRRKLDEWPTRAQARRQLIRGVEDRIQRSTRGAQAETLRAELAERLDSPELADELGHRPTEAVIADICRDLGLENDQFCHRYQRRTPRDVAALHATADRPARTPAGCGAPWRPTTAQGP